MMPVYVIRRANPVIKVWDQFAGKIVRQGTGMMALFAPSRGHTDEVLVIPGSLVMVLTIGECANGAKEPIHRGARKTG
jgi:hypothetical protein